MPNPASPQIEMPSQHYWRPVHQQWLPGTLNPKLPPTLLPIPDRSLAFAAAAQERMNGALVRCEERYPNAGHHSVLYVVVDRDGLQWRERLGPLHEEYFGGEGADPLAPVRLEVVDRATDEALQRLLEAGLLAKTSRATRPLWSVDGLESEPSPLSADEQAKLAAYRQLAARKLKMARVVAEAGLEEDARAPLLDAILALSRAHAVQQRLPEPTLVSAAMLPPLSPSWKQALPLLREFTLDAAYPSKPVLEALGCFLPE